MGRRFVAPDLPRVALAVVLISLGLAAPAAGDSAGTARPTGTFVGLAGQTAIAVVIDGRSVQAYVCDGRGVGRWSSVPRTGPRLALGGGAVLLAGSPSVRVVLGGRTISLSRARGRAGLYRADTRRNGQRELGGWVVLPSGRQIGTVAVAGGIEPAPKLNTTTLVAGSGTNQLIAGIVLPPGPQALIADFAGDGFDLGGRVRTGLAGGGKQLVRWTRAGDDDTFVALDADVLRSLGFSLRSESGRAQTGVVLARGGIVVGSPSGVSTVATEGLHLLRLLDHNGDAVLSDADPASEALRAFRDVNGDGVLALLEAKQEELRNEREIVKTAFEDFDRRANALFNALSSIVRAQGEILTGVAFLGL